MERAVTGGVKVAPVRAIVCDRTRLGECLDRDTRRFWGVAVDDAVNRDEFAGASAEDGSAGRGPPRSDGPWRPDPGEPPATRPTSPIPREIEFVPQAPTRWLAPKLLVLIGVQVALSTKFAEFFDRRDAYAGVSTALPEKSHPGADRNGGRRADGDDPASRWSLTEATQGFDFTGTDELWLDYISDSGDGFNAT